jgi:hypothetical protein
MTATLSVKCPVVKSLAKDISDTKNFAKEFVKEIEKSQQVDKNLVDKAIDKKIEKGPEKPVIDKTAGLDKNPAEGKIGEKIVDGGLPGGGGFPGGFTGARSRSGGEAEPFIGGELRPDLTEGALAGEEDAAAGEQPQINSPQGKRMFDSKMSEA